jgi:hypothetical protein
VTAIILRWLEKRNVRQGEKSRPNNCRSFHRKSTPGQPYPYILCGLFLTLPTSRSTIRRVYCFARCVQKFARDHWGKHDAIFAGVDGAVHQSGMFCARALVAGTSFRPQRWPGILPKLRKFLAGGTAADRSAPSHEAASTDCTAAAPQATIDFLLASRHHTKGRRRFSLRPFLFLFREQHGKGFF